jgi:heme-degrading monooxygenase HmoA
VNVEEGDTMNGSRSASNFSIAIWLIKAGREAEFIAAWQDFATWTSDIKVGALGGTLVQDSEDPRKFICFWPFDSEEGIRQWRAEPKFRSFMMRMRAYCESCQPSTGRTVGQVAVPI